jgi:uncharacterized protein YbcI
VALSTKEVVPIVDRPESSRGSDEPSAGQQPVGPEDPSAPDQARQPPTQAEIDEEIGREILGILEESYGRGAASAQAFVTDGWVIVVADELELLPNEQFLVDRGDRDTVAHVRAQYQHAIQANFRAAIERATGRRVIGFASTTSVEEPRFMAEIFKLE